ncbi:MAG: hypothetical protein CMC82_02945 [Flavobacteriaceae bacterium]|nr:hypothetical protein [Flavobacteriaceae bacterium]
MIDNRNHTSGAVVVVPSDEWDSMRQASLAASQVATLSETSDPEAEKPLIEIEPTPGSEAIKFSNYTSSNLGGCVTAGIIEVQHRGAVNDAITLLKNQAFTLNGNALIVIRMNSTLENQVSTINIEARMLTCPLRLAKGN